MTPHFFNKNVRLTVDDKIHVTQIPVRTQPQRQLESGWTVNIEESLKVAFSDDFQRSLIDELSEQIAADIDAEIIGTLTERYTHLEYPIWTRILS